MRITLTAGAAFLALTVPAVANRCYWVGHHIYCDAGCWVTHRWWDGSREWMRYACGPSPEEIAVIAGLALIVVVLVILVVSAARGRPAQADVERDTATTNDITAAMEDVMRRADQHIAAMRNKHRGD